MWMRECYPSLYILVLAFFTHNKTYNYLVDEKDDDDVRVCIQERTKICVYVPLTYLVQHVNMYTSFSCSIRRENYFYYYYNHYYNNGDEDEDHKKTKPTVH